jgi:hypothetical protein
MFLAKVLVLLRRLRRLIQSKVCKAFCSQLGCHLLAALFNQLLTLIIK